MFVYDLREISASAKRHGAITVLDSTFASPIFQNGLSLGFDVVLHSCSKYLGGHSDIVAGALMTNSLEIKQKLDFTRTSMGLHSDPFTMFLLRRSLKTLPLRMAKHQSNAMILSKYLEGHKLVRRVLYPGLESHPQHHIAVRQMHGFSGMMSVEFDVDISAVSKLIAGFKLFKLAESLGGVESLVEQPALMTHLKIPANVRKAHGLADALVRFSVGIEDAEDLVDDLDGALSALSVEKRLIEPCALVPKTPLRENAPSLLSLSTSSPGFFRPVYRGLVVSRRVMHEPRRVCALSQPTSVTQRHCLPAGPAQDRGSLAGGGRCADRTRARGGRSGDS